MALFDDPDTPFDAPDVGFDEAGEGGIPPSAGYKLWLKDGRLVTRFNSPGRVVLCPECPCPEDTGTGTGTGTATGTAGDITTVEITCCSSAVIQISSRLVFTVLSVGFPSAADAPGCHSVPAGQAVPSYVSLGNTIEVNFCGTIGSGGLGGNYYMFASEALPCPEEPGNFPNYLWVAIFCMNFTPVFDKLTLAVCGFYKDVPGPATCDFAEGALGLPSDGCTGSNLIVIGCPDGMTGTGTRPDADPIRVQGHIDWVGNTGNLSQCCFPENVGGLLPNFCGSVIFELEEVFS